MIPLLQLVLVIASRSGTIQFVDPGTLQTLSTATVSVAPAGTGLQGVFADPDGRTLYVEGPADAGAGNCCWLYSIDLATLQTKVAAGIWGSASRSHIVTAGPGLIKAASAPDGGSWQSSPDGHWFTGVKNGSVQIYDVAKAQITRTLPLPGSDESIWSTGAWLGNRFYVYARHRLWSLSHDTTHLDDGVPISVIKEVPGCSSEGLVHITAAGDHLFLYEGFGGVFDRRDRCGSVPGGVRLVDPGSLNLAANLASTEYFWTLIPSADGSEFHAITAESLQMQTPARLLRISSKTGTVLQQRTLDAGYSFLTLARLASLPAEDASITLTSEPPPTRQASAPAAAYRSPPLRR